VYVRLGYEFNLACRAFNSIGVETSDLGPVPDLLRHILEDTLSQPASPQALDNYLPRIRDIIINLLHGLKRKQSRLRGRGSKDGGAPPTSGVPPLPSGRPAGVAGTGSNETGLTQMLEDETGATAAGGGGRIAKRHDSVPSTDDQTYAPADGGAMNRQSLRRDIGRPFPQSGSPSFTVSTTAPTIAGQPSYKGPQQLPAKAFLHPPPPPPPPPPKTQDALTALQRGGDLERRASRRFSAYQIQKHLGPSSNGVRGIPPAQNSPIPNRGREARESLNAVRSRTSYQQSRARSVRQPDGSPSRGGAGKVPQRISEEREDALAGVSLPEAPQIKAGPESVPVDSPTTKTPDEYHQPPGSTIDKSDSPIVGATLNGPISSPPEDLGDIATPHLERAPSPPQHQEPVDLSTDKGLETGERRARDLVTPPPSQILAVDTSPPQGKELTLFLQYKTKIKKFILPEGYDELTIPRLQLAFIEKFAWNTHHNGVDLPEMYIQDPVSGVRHELEDLSDVKDRSVLVLNVEVLDEVKKHIDEGLGTLQKTLDGVRSLLDGQSMMMQRFSDRQLQTSKEMARMSAMPSQRPSRTPTLAPGPFPGATTSERGLQEVQSLRRDIAVLRQTYSTMSSDFTAAMSDIKAKAANVKAAAIDASQPSYKGDAGRAHINQSKKALSEDSEALVNRVDDLSDIVEELRKDVVTRGVRPLPRQLEDINKEISATAKQLAKVKEVMKREKPIWTKIWEQELQVVMTERDDLTQQDELMNDLDGDLDDVTSVFKLVEEATKQQNLQANTPVGALRSTSKNLAFDSAIDPHEAKNGMLDEVRALQPNHENRLEAIERAEKARQKELESRKGGEFQREVEKFVEEGRLKKTGGAEEVERMRKLKDERARKENWERLQARQADMERRQAAATATEAAKEDGKAHIESTAQEMENDTSQQDEAASPAGNEDNVQAPLAETPASVPVKDSAHGITTDGPPQLPEVTGDGDGQKESGTLFLDA